MPSKGDFKTNSFWLVGDAAYIYVGTSKHPRAICVIDADDLPLVLGSGKWSAHENHKCIYARRNGPRSIVQIHTLIMGTRWIDHRDGNGLNNRRSNLRVATPAENARNRRSHSGTYSTYKGVTWDKSRNKWLTQVMKDYTFIYREAFDDEVAAARAYDAVARQHFGEFARLNFKETV